MTEQAECRVHQVGYETSSADDSARVTELEIELDAARTKIDNLEKALHSARVIGAAVGVVMTTERVTYESAFGILVTVSQRTQRKLRDLADEVLLTGSWSSGR